MDLVNSQYAIGAVVTDHQASLVLRNPNILYSETFSTLSSPPMVSKR